MTRLANLAAFVAGASAEAIPDEAIRLARLALVDLIGVTLAGADEPVSRIVARQITASSSDGSATVIGQGMRAGPADAALVNATIGHALDFDDSNMVLGGHPTVVVLPAVLALAEARRCSGRAVLEAYVVGFEVTLAMAAAVNFDHFEKGWHPTATLGVFGAAAACARLLRLSAAQCEAALGLACAMASGVKASFGTMAKPLQVGEASRRGVLCAMLAQDGATASTNALEARQGFLEVYNGAGHYRAEALDAVGNGWEILRSGLKFKKYACCGSTHAPIDAALALREQHRLRPDAIAQVRIGLNPRRRTHVDRPVVDGALAAKFSVQFAVAAALTDGAVRLRQFSDAEVGRPDIRALMDRTVVGDLGEGDAGLSQACEVAVTTVGGECFSLRLQDAQGRGSEDYPGFMAHKFHDCVEGRLGENETDDLIAALLSLDRQAEIGPVMSRLASRSASPIALEHSR